MASRSALSVVSLFLGLALLAGSWALPIMLSPRDAWNVEDAREYQEAAGQLHEFAGRKAFVETPGTPGTAARGTPASSSAGASDSAAAAEPAPRRSEEYVAAQERVRLKQAKLESAKRRGQFPATILWWSGIGLVVIGVAAYAAGQPKQ